MLYSTFNAALQPVEKKKQTREKISKETIKFIVDYLTSEEQQQGVAHGTIQIKDPSGKRVKIARSIRRQQNAELIRQVQVLLKENDLQVPAKSTLRKLFHLMPAGNAKEIKGLDPVYENHRRAFVSLQGVCTELQDIFIAKEDNEKIDLIEKVQQGFATSASYLLGFFAYNLSTNSSCLSHCVNFACSDGKNKKQQMGCDEESLDFFGKHPEDCDYCNLFYAAFDQLEKLFDGAKENFSPKGIEQKLDIMEKGKESIIAYKKQVFRHYVSSGTWAKYYRHRKKNQVYVVMDFAMKWLEKVGRETQPEWFAKKGMSWMAIAYERMIQVEEEWMIVTEVHIQVLNNTTKQDSTSVVALVLASLKLFKVMHPEIEEAIFSADNAGYYHCEDTIKQLWSQRKSVPGMTLLGLHFSEPGKGKSVCDQYFAILKALVLRAICAGRAADTPRAFAEAMCYGEGVANTVIMLGDIIDPLEGEKKETVKIENISKYHEFLFSDEGILLRYLPGFGEGEIKEMDRELEDQ